MSERQQGVQTMSKSRPGRQSVPPATFVTTSTPAAPAPILPESVDAAPVIARTSSGRVLADHRHCPICWSGSQGYGTAYSTAPNGRTYYRCNQALGELPPCGHTWSVLIQTHTVIVTHKTVDFDGMR